MLSAVCTHSSEVASMVVHEDGAGVVKDIAGKYRTRCSLQFIGMELLAAMARTEVMHCASIDGL